MLALALACRPPPPPDVLLVTLDTTRADALGAYGAAPSPSPAFDALAARGLLVEEALSTAPLTLPAHASLMTGRDPDLHGLRDNHTAPLPPEAETLAERFHEAGWATGAFVGAVVLDAAFGLDQGFDVYEGGFDLGADVPGVAQWPGDVVRGRAEAWLETLPPDRPFFAWVHLYDAHQPRAPHPGPLDPYAAEVAFADAQLGALLERLEALGRDHTIVVVAGDHGEGNGEHGEATHGLFAWRSTMRVPLVVAGPGVDAGAVAGPRSLVEVAPTLVRLAGLPPMDGATLFDERSEPVYGETLWPRAAFGLSDLRVLQDDRWRFVRAPRPELYDWRADPGEERNVAGDHPDVVAARMAALAARPEVSAPGGAPIGVSEALAALGYLPSVGSGWDPGRDPKDHPDLPERFEAAVVAARTRPPAEGAALLTAFLAEWPDAGAARMLLSRAWGAAGDPTRAREALGPLLAANPGDPSLRAREAALWLDEGRAEEARAALGAVRGEHPMILAVRAEIERRDGRCDRAVAVAEQGLARWPRTSALRRVRGACRLEAGDLAGAEVDLSAARAADPGDVGVALQLGLALARQGRPGDALPHLAQAAEAGEGRGAYGLALHAVGRCAEALPHLEAALDEPESAVFLADCRLTLGLPGVEEALAAAALRDPKHPALARVRAGWLLTSGDAEAAVAELARALEAR